MGGTGLEPVIPSLSNLSSSGWLGGNADRERGAFPTHLCCLASLASVIRRGLFLVALGAALAGCGSSSQSNVSSHPTRSVAQPNRQCHGSKDVAERNGQRARLDADLRRLRTAVKTVKGHTQNGNRALNAVLDRFLLDVAENALPVKERSRFINAAAAIVAPRCSLCFQALESNRPTAAGAKLPCD
jgi:hypothetical protein